MALAMWSCACGRRVPMTVAHCRCGKPRPEPAETLAGGAETIAKQPPAASSGGTWLPKLLGLLVLVALYFGSRMLNRFNTSKDARAAAVQGLGQVLDKQQASDMVRRHHDLCFDQYYKTGWGRRQRADFETDKYARCVIDKVMADLERESSTLQRAAAKAARSPRATPEPAPVATAAAQVPLRGVWEKAALEDVKVTEWQRGPQMKVRAEFVLAGAQLTQRGQCVLQVNCQGQPPGKTVGIGCVLQGDAQRATGSVRYYSEVPAPPSGSCELSLQLFDGTTTRSNPVVVPLQ
jgi:hypothetical protein